MSAPGPQTLLFGTVVYGDGPPATDDPAELFHEASRFYPDVVDTSAVGGALLGQSPELQASARRAVRRRTGLPPVPLPEAEPARASLDTLVAARRSTRGTRTRRFGWRSSRRCSRPATASPTRSGCSRSARSRRVGRSIRWSSISRRSGSSRSGPRSTTSIRFAPRSSASARSGTTSSQASRRTTSSWCRAPPSR